MDSVHTPQTAAPHNAHATKANSNTANKAANTNNAAQNEQTGVFGTIFSQLITGPNLQNDLTAQGELTSTLESPLTSQDDLLAFLQNISQDLQGGDVSALTAQIGQLSTQDQNTLGEILLVDGADLGADAGLLDRINAQIQALQNDGGAGSILFNLTPDQMTQLQKDLALAAETGELPEPPEGFAFIAVGLTTPNNQIAGKAQDSALIQTLSLAKQQKAANQIDEISSLNAITQSAAEDGLNFDNLLDIQSSTEKFSALLKNAAKMREAAAGDYTTQNKIPAQGSNSEANAQQNAIMQESAALTANGALSGQSAAAGDLISAFAWDEQTLFAMGASPSAPAPGTNASIAQLTNTSTHAQHATQAHPSTTMVAATLSKAAGASENKSITLQLDPPELGRIEVRMEFGKDRTLKAQIITEKPEAYMMMQRDADTLQKALQDSGLETSNNDIEFTLAEDGHDFENNGRHDGSRNHASYNGNEQNEDSEDLDTIQIETTMTWNINPETGHTHYSILV